MVEENTLVVVHPPKNVRKVRMLQETEEDDRKKYIKITPDIIVGLLVTLLIFVTVFIGINCMGAIDTPKQYQKELFLAGKEY